MIDFVRRLTLPQLYAWVGPFTTPVPSGLALAYHMYLQFSEAPMLLRIMVGSGAFFGFEAAGGTCASAVILLHNRKRYNVDFWVCLLGIIGYIAAPSIIMVYGGGFLIFATLAAVTVFAANTWFQLHLEEKRVKEERELTLKQTRAATKLQRLQNASAMQGDAKPIQIQHFVCGQCQEEFDNPRKYAAHIRWAHKVEEQK